jgi:general secretion pathway protein G
MRNNSGFTLLELILVMVIISILAGTVVVAVSGRGTQAREIRAKSDLRVYQTAIEAYALEHNDQYPKTLSQLATPNKKGIQYVMEIKNDGWGRPYVYNFPGKKNKYDLYSLGADGQTGTADDISVWDSENARE